MKNIFAAIFVTILAFSLVGCGGGGGSNNSSTFKLVIISGSQTMYHYNQTYKYYVSTGLGSFQTQSPSLTNCHVQIKNTQGLPKGITFIGVSQSGNTCIFSLKNTNNNVQNVNVSDLVTFLGTVNGQPRSASETIKAYHKNSTPPTVLHDVWRLNFPSGVAFPLFVYEIGHMQSTLQYITGSAQPTYLGYMGELGVGSYQILVPPSSSHTSQYTGCTITLTKTNFNQAQSTCTNLVKQGSLSGNVQSLSFAAQSFPTVIPTSIPTPPANSLATVTFINHYPVPVEILAIRNNVIQPRITIPAGSPHIFTNVQTRSSLTTNNFEVVKIGNVDTGLNGPNQTNYGTLFEIDYHKLTNPTSSSTAVTTDMSMVNGFNIKFSMFPSKGQWASSSFSEFDSKAGSKVLFYDETNPAATFAPPQGLEALCSSIASQMQTYDGFFIPQSLFSVNSNSVFAGCLSPQKFTVAKGTSTNKTAEYGCTNNFSTPATCTMAAGSPYVTELHKVANKALNGYAFAFNDSSSTFSSYPDNTSFTVDLNPALP